MSSLLQDQLDSHIPKKISDRNEFLFHAGHLVFATCPQLSRFYLSEFQASLQSQELTPAKAIARQLCPQCGQLYVAGLNTTITLEPNRPTRSHRRGKSNSGCRTNQKRRRNVLVYECLACHHKSRLPGSERIIPKATITTGTCTELVQPSAFTTTVKPMPPAASFASRAATATPVPRPSSTTPPSRSASSSPVPGNNKKKKKKSNLQAMLASRRNVQGSNPSAGGLGLDDFLSSL